MTSHFPSALQLTKALSHCRRAIHTIPRLTKMAHNNDTVVEKLKKFTRYVSCPEIIGLNIYQLALCSCDVSDGLCKLNHANGGFLSGLTMWSPKRQEGDTKIVGPAYTVKYVPLDDPAPKLPTHYVSRRPSTPSCPCRWDLKLTLLKIDPDRLRSGRGSHLRVKSAYAQRCLRRPNDAPCQGQWCCRHRRRWTLP